MSDYWVYKITMLRFALRIFLTQHAMHLYNTRWQTCKLLPHKYISDVCREATSFF
jgi:hypothetical protein